eukprot:symbB.v1.2.040375.t1/scaffold6900.1/size14724/3
MHRSGAAPWSCSCCTGPFRAPVSRKHGGCSSGDYRGGHGEGSVGKCVSSAFECWELARAIIIQTTIQTVTGLA